VHRALNPSQWDLCGPNLALLLLLPLLSLLLLQVTSVPGGVDCPLLLSNTNLIWSCAASLVLLLLLLLCWMC
jgi:hypothetical protein